MDKTAVFFGPINGAVHSVAKRIEQLVGEDKVELISVADASVADLERFDKIIFGISTVGKETWHSSYSNKDWAKFLPEIGKTEYAGKTIAIYGLGDHITYAATFVDHIGVLAKELINNGAVLSGQVPIDEYTFDESEAVIDGVFVGLPLDEVYESDLTNNRLKKWIEQLTPIFGF